MMEINIFMIYLYDDPLHAVSGNLIIIIYNSEHITNKTEIQTFISVISFKLYFR